MKKVLAAILVMALVSTGRADEAAVAGRDLLKKYENAVLTIKLVINQAMSYGGRQGRKQEEKSEVTGTVINDSGLIVVSLSATDPASAMAGVMGGGGESDSQMKMESDISDIRIALPGGRDIPGKIVLRDKDLDLAFVVPSTTSKDKWTAVDLGVASRPNMLDQVIVLNRLGHVASRTPSASVGRITAIVDKPRTYYVMDHDMGSLGLGSPVYGTDGKLIGLLAIRTAPLQSRLGMAAMFSGASSMGIMPVVVPADQIKEAAEQVPAETDKKSDEKADK